jgi:hypothetical protein
MAVRFPDEPGFVGRYAPMQLAGETCGLELTQGAVPDTLRGTYYRADPAARPGRRDEQGQPAAQREQDGEERNRPAGMSGTSGRRAVPATG